MQTLAAIWLNLRVEWSKRSVTDAVFVVTATRFQVLPLHLSLDDLTTWLYLDRCCVVFVVSLNQASVLLTSPGNFRPQPDLPSRFVSKRLTIFVMKMFIRKLEHSSIAFARLACFYLPRSNCLLPRSLNLCHSLIPRPCAIRLRPRIWSPNPWPQPIPSPWWIE